MQHNHLKHPKLYDRHCQLKIVGGSFIDYIALKIRATDREPSCKEHININSEWQVSHQECVSVRIKYPKVR